MVGDEAGGAGGVGEDPADDDTDSWIGSLGHFRNVSLTKTVLAVILI